jgi:Trypsin-co-occurring domain 2
VANANGGVELADYLAALQAELHSVPTPNAAGGPSLRPADVSLAVTVVYSKTADGRGRLFVVQADDEAEASHHFGARLTLALRWDPVVGGPSYLDRGVYVEEVEMPPPPSAGSGGGDW